MQYDVDIMSKVINIVWLCVSSCVYEIPRLLSLLVLAYSITSKDERDIPSSLGFPLQLCCIKCSPTLTGIFVVFLNVDDLHLLGVNIGVWLCS